MERLQNISISLDSIKEGLIITIDAHAKGTLFDTGPNPTEYIEARFQLIEGCQYYYEFNDRNFTLGKTEGKIIQPHPRNRHMGIISPNIWVGTLALEVFESEKDEKSGVLELEVQSAKAGYRDEYKDMLELITEKCTDLLLQANSPVSHHFETDFNRDSETLYQRFAFIKSIIGTVEFSDAVHRIVTAPVTRWVETTESTDVRQVRRFSNANLKELLKGGNRTPLPDNHYFRSKGLNSLPSRIETIRKTDSVDTPENRFIKHALETFLKFCTEINTCAKRGSKLEKESLFLIRELESQLHHTIFRDISRPLTLKLNSPVLQRKEGYREILRVWLMFDLAAKLIWSGGEDVYGGGKKDIATLYEYWLFFKLLELLQSVFSIDPKDISDLIKETPDGLNLQLKQGVFTALSGVYDSGTRKLNVRFNYNRSFSGNKIYPDSGSWTTTLRPDYTLSFWPLGISENVAEKEELITHIHFDAKYKIENFARLLEQKENNELDEEKKENRKGVYKNADLLKMHAYKDAIRRTGGAYVLYPGVKPHKKEGFHEIIPGLGAFPVRPSKTDSGIGELKTFILEVLSHFLNRASQRERIAAKTYDIFLNKPGEPIEEPLPEAFGKRRGFTPDDTFVLVGFVKENQYEWVKQKQLYNFRMGSGEKGINLLSEIAQSKYLLLHLPSQNESGELWRITGNGPKLMSAKDLINNNYPTKPTHPFYFVVDIEPIDLTEFGNAKWKFKKLEKYKGGRQSAYPFAVSVSELMKTKVKL